MVIESPSCRLAFRVDASITIGTGHVMRCLTLADALTAQGAECHFICHAHLGHMIDAIRSRGFKTYSLCHTVGGAIESADNAQPEHAAWLDNSWQHDAEQTADVLRCVFPDWLVVDHYALDARWETRVCDAIPGAGLMVIDDLADRAHQADVLLDQNLGRRVQDYHALVPKHCRCLVGPRYALLRPEFAEWRDWSLERRRHGGPVKRLLVSLGGVDKDNVTGQVLNALSGIDLPAGMEITVVMGASAPWLEHVRHQAQELPCVTEVVVNVIDMARRMAEADLAIGAAGSTTWERCCLGLPTILLVLAENQEEIARALQVEGAAHVLPTADVIRELTNQSGVIAQRHYLDRLSRSAASLVDGAGVGRVRSELIKASL